MVEEKILTINIGKRLIKVPKWKRTGKALRIIRGILEKQTKTKVKIDKNVNEKIWKRGIENPPTKLRIKIVKVDDKTSKAELIE